MKAEKQIPRIEELPLFDCLNEAEKDHLKNCTEYRTVKKHGYIYLPDEMSGHIYVLLKGTIKIGSYSDSGREVIKCVVYPEDIFGELGLVGEPIRKDFAKTLNDEVKICILKTSDFQYLMANNQALSFRVINIIGKRLRRAEQRLEALIFKDARSRIVDFLKENVKRRGLRIGYEMLLKHTLTQQDIANLTGTSRQTVTSVLNDLRKSNLIYFNRRNILIRDVQKLA